MANSEERLASAIVWRRNRLATLLDLLGRVEMAKRDYDEADAQVLAIRAEEKGTP